MNKKKITKVTGLFFCILAVSQLLTGCGKSRDIVLYGSEEEYGKAQLCDYNSLSVTKNVYEITDEMVNEQIEMLASENIEYKEVDRPIEENDYVDMLLTISCDGEVLYDFSKDTEEEQAGYEISVGYEEFGEEFDQRLIGAKKGDHLAFSVSYEEDYELDEFAGKTIDYDLTISSVTVEEMPELTDEYIKNTLGYDSMDALFASTKEDLAGQYEQDSVNEVKTSLLSMIIEDSVFEEYSPEIISSYKASVEDSYASYMEMFGASTIDEIYSMFEITPEDIEAEALSIAKEMTVIHQIGREQNITVSQKEYDDLLAGYATENEYDSTEEFIADYGEEEIRNWILEDKVYAYLYEHASITEVTVDADDMGEADVEEYDEDDAQGEWIEGGEEEGILLGDEEILELTDDEWEDAFSDEDAGEEGYEEEESVEDTADDSNAPDASLETETEEDPAVETVEE